MDNIIGIIPAAGIASRLSPLPCSKEILPVGIAQWGDKPYKRPKVAMLYVLESMRMANIRKAYIIIRNNKWDIPAYLGDGKSFGIDVAYLIMGLPYGTPFSIDQAYPFITSSIVTLGYPDIIFHPQNVYRTLLQIQKEKRADLVLGLYPAKNPEKMDMIEFDSNNKISRIIIKPKETQLRYTYINAVWTPVFSKFMNEYLTYTYNTLDKSTGNELYVGDIFQAFINDGNSVEYSIIEKGYYIDIGTVSDYADAITNFSKI